MIKLKSVLLFSLLLLVSGRRFSNAQGKENLLGLGFGGSSLHLVDYHAASIVFRGTGIAPTIWWSYKNNRNNHLVQGSFFHNNLSSSAANFRTEIYCARGRYSYLHTFGKIADPERHFDFLFGGSITTYFLNSDYFFYKSAFRARAIASWYWSQSVDMAFELDYSPSDRNKLFAQFNLPLFSNVSRPGYSSSDNYNYSKNDWEIKPFGQTVFFPENLTLNANIAYRQYISPKINLILSYEFNYINYDNADNIRMYTNNFRIGLSYNIN
jgi:hypothetical protein